MTSGEFATGPGVLFLRLEPSWLFVDEIRRFVESFCAAACPGAEREEQLALAAHELVQNALSYACAPGVELRCEVDGVAGSVRVSVTNAAEPEQADRLRARVAEVSGYPDALTGYVAAMRKAPHERGGLGLARVRFEASLDLAVDVDRDRVTVHAAGPLAPAGGAPSALRGRDFAVA